MFRVKLNWFWRYTKMSNSISRDVGFFPKELAQDFGSKFQISSKLVFAQIGPSDNVCLCFRVKLKWFWRYMKISNFISHHLRFFRRRRHRYYKCLKQKHVEKEVEYMPDSVGHHYYFILQSTKTLQLKKKKFKFAINYFTVETI